jgi:hypothetical protein
VEFSVFVHHHDFDRDLVVHEFTPLTMNEDRTLSEIVGPWEETKFESGLITRCRDAWTKPIGSLNREELATLLRQKIAVSWLLPIARKKVEDRSDDDSEMYEGELAAAIEYAQKA